jgi:hypothetical protein
LWIHGCKIDDDEAVDHYTSILDLMELTTQQMTTITKICFNLGLDRFQRQKYEMAVTWLKTSYRYGIRTAFSIESLIANEPDIILFSHPQTIKEQTNSKID